MRPCDLLPRGRDAFIEMGKTDLRDAQRRTSHRASGRTLSSAFELMDAGHERIQDAVAAEFAVLFEQDVLFCRCHLSAVYDLRLGTGGVSGYMAEARHVGKLVLLPPYAARCTKPRVLITGGLGGLGRADGPTTWSTEHTALRASLC